MTSPWRHQVPLPHQLLSDQLEQNDAREVDEVDVDGPQIQVDEGRVAQSLCGPFGAEFVRKLSASGPTQLPFQRPRKPKDPSYGPWESSGQCLGHRGLESSNAVDQSEAAQPGVVHGVNQRFSSIF